MSGNKKKILIYSPKFYPSTGGLENLTLMLARAFMKHGHQVRVITEERGDGTDCGVETYYKCNVLKKLSLYNWCDIFYMPNISLKGAWLHLINPKKKWVVSHNGWYERSDGTIGWQDRLKQMLARYTVNIAVSGAVAKHISEPCTVIYNCYDDRIFHQKYDTDRTSDFLFVGRLVSDKGIDTLLEAYKILVHSGRQFSLTIAGTGPLEEWLVKEIEACKLTGVNYLGLLKGERLAEEMNRHKVLVVPSNWNEPFGIVALEGLACGCKIVCSAGGGLPEAAGQGAFLFSNRDAAECASQMSNAIEQDGDRNAVANHLQYFTIQRTSAGYLDLMLN